MTRRWMIRARASALIGLLACGAAFDEAIGIRANLLGVEEVVVLPMS